jgi:hypothetical protein
VCTVRGDREDISASLPAGPTYRRSRYAGYARCFRIYQSYQPHVNPSSQAVQGSQYDTKISRISDPYVQSCNPGIQGPSLIQPHCIKGADLVWNMTTLFHHKRSDQSSSAVIVLGLVRAIGRSRPRTVSVPQLPSPGPQRDKSGQVGESIGPICVEAFPPPVENPTTSISRASSRKIVCDSGIIKKAQPLLSFLPRFTNEYPYPNLT